MPKIPLCSRTGIPFKYVSPSSKMSADYRLEVFREGEVIMKVHAASGSQLDLHVFIGAAGLIAGDEEGDPVLDERVLDRSCQCRLRHLAQAAFHSPCGDAMLPP